MLTERGGADDRRSTTTTYNQRERAKLYIYYKSTIHLASVAYP